MPIPACDSSISYKLGSSDLGQFVQEAKDKGVQCDTAHSPVEGVLGLVSTGSAALL